MGELRTFLNELAYYSTLKAFATGSYDLKKEMLLAKLRAELLISDYRHATLRKAIEEGKAYEDLEGSKATAAQFLGQPASKQRDRQAGVEAGGAKPPDSPFELTGQKRSAAHMNGTRGGNLHKRSRQEGSYMAASTRPSIAAGVDIDELIGYKVDRWWPEHGGWYEGAITDFRLSTGEHCIAYDMNTDKESYEWFNLTLATEKEFRILDERINIIEHAPKGPAKPSSNSKPPPIKPGGSGRIWTSGRGRGRGRVQRAVATNGGAGPPGGYFTNHGKAERRPTRAVEQPTFRVESDDEPSTDDSLSE